MKTNKQLSVGTTERIPFVRRETGDKDRLAPGGPLRGCPQPAQARLDPANTRWDPQVRSEDPLLCDLCVLCGPNRHAVVRKARSPEPPRHSHSGHAASGGARHSLWQSSERGLVDDVLFICLLGLFCLGLLFANPSTLNAQPSINCTRCPSGLIAWWPADGSTTNLAGSGNGTLRNGATYAAGKVGQAFSLDGVNDYVEMPNPTYFNFGRTSPMSVSLWAYRTGSASTMHLLGKRDDCGATGMHYQLALDTGGLGFFGGSAGAKVACQLPRYAWTHLAATFDGATFRIYTNGYLAAIGAGTLGPQATTALRIGASGTCGNTFAGLLDEVAIFNRALPLYEVVAICVAATNGICKDRLPPTLLTWPTNEVVALNSNHTLSVSASGMPPLSYQWFFNQSPVLGANSSDYTICSAQAPQTGNYSVVVSNAYGSACSPYASLVVFRLPYAADVIAGPIVYPANGHYYFLLDQDSWTASEDEAVEIGGHLVTISDATENRWVLNTFSRYGGVPRALWLGLSDAVKEGAFVWATREPVSYAHWWSGEPNNLGGAENYTHMYDLDRGAHAGYWNDCGNGTSENGVPLFGVVEVDPATLSLTCALPEDFETSVSAWNANNAVWNIGRPVTGPHAAHSGTNAAGTMLDANYPQGLSSRLVGAPFQVPSVAGADFLVLRFWQWYQYGTGDAGVVQLERWTERGWRDWETLDIPATNGSSRAWSQAVVDLRCYQGQQVRLGFLHTADSDGSVGAGWYIDELSLSSLVPNPMQLGQDVTGVFNAVGDRAYYVIDVPSGGHLRLRLDDLDNLGANEVYLRRGSLPSAGVYDARFGTNALADQSVLAADAGAGKWYVLVYNASGPVPSDFTIQADFFTGVALESVTPSSLGNSVPGTLDIRGAGFTPSTTVTLVGGGTTNTPTELGIVSSSQILADFDFPAIPAGSHALRVTSGTNCAELPFTVVAGGEAKFYSKLIVPQSVGRHAPAEIYIEYANIGSVPMPPPLLVLTGTERPIMNLVAAVGSSSEYQRGFWTATMPAGWSGTVQFLASGSTPGVLQPGESNRIAVAFAGLQQPWSWAPTVRFDLGVLTATNAAPVDWDLIKPNMRPADLTDAQWDALWYNFTQQAGATWGEYVGMLNGNARYLGKLGLNVQDLRDLLAFEYAQADGLNIMRRVAAATDAYAPTPGLGLVFGRVFPQSLIQRHAAGPLGYGWSHNWEFTLTLDADGDVTVVGPAGSRRLFQPDRRGGWFSQPGDHGTLIELGSGRFSLREPRGLVRVFRSDGKLDCVEDPNGNRITANWSGGFLTSLAHSAGQRLQFAYMGSLIQSVTDPVGRTTTFTYDSDRHLIGALYFDTNEVAYTYGSGHGLACEHALTSITYPGGLQQVFTYNAHGRLESMSQGCCGSSVNFAYDSFGTVTVSDNLTNRTKFQLDHHGLLAKLENPLKNTLRFAYDGEFNLTSLTDPAGRAFTYGYDDTGNLVQMTDALGGSTRLNYAGAFNRLAQLADAKGNLTRYSHDAQGNLSAITYANGTVERWAYDPAGNLITWTNRRTQRISYQFNTNGQLTAKLYPDGSRAIYGYDARGNLTLASNYVGAVTLAYDASDRLQRITYPGNRWLEYTYNAAGQRAAMTDQLGYRLDYDYDAAGRLRSLANPDSLRLVLYEYDPAGRLARKTLGNNVFSTYGYDSVGQLLTLTNATRDGTALSFFNYTYDNRGRRVAMDAHYGRWDYAYDDLGQLTCAVLAPTSTDVPSQDLTYVYDALGNRVRTIENGVTTEYTVNNMNQYLQVGSTSYAYDADGNVVRGSSGTRNMTNTFDFDSRLVAVDDGVSNWRRDFGPLAAQIAVTSSNTLLRRVVDPVGNGNLTAEYASNGSLVSRQAFGSGLLNRSRELEGTEYLTFDPNGNLSEACNARGEVVASTAFTPFGRALITQSGAAGDVGYAGELGVVAKGDGVFVVGRRLYDPNLGRCLSPEPFPLRSGHINLYRFARNNPNSFVDASGDDEISVTVGIPQTPFKVGGGGGMSDDGFLVVCASLGVSFDLDFVKAPKFSVTTDGSDVSASADLGFADVSYGTGAPDEGFDISVSAPLYPGVGIGGSATDSSKKSVTLGAGSGVGVEAKGCWKTPIRIPWFPPNPNPPNPPTDVADGGTSANSASVDPNSLVGPAGYGVQNFVAAGSLLPYRINFENQTNATAPAQSVTLQNVLTTNLDLAALELSSIGFGDRFFAIPAGSQHYERTETLTMNGFRFQVQIEAGLNLSTRTVYATFKSLNPTNSLPPPVEIGFLPPENGTGRGQGHLAYVIRPKSGLATGTEIRNVATIVFDQQPAIATDWISPTNPAVDPTKQALVTIDADAPSSTVNALPAVGSSSAFEVCWSGTDIGAGISGYDVYVKTNQGPWVLWLANTPDTCALFHGLNNDVYGFFSIARDGTGQTETAPAGPDTTIRMAPNFAPTLAAVSNRVVRVNETLVITNVASDSELGPQTLLFSLDGAPEGATIRNLTDSTGLFRWTPQCRQGSTTNLVTVRVTDAGIPPMSVTTSFIVTVPECVEASAGNAAVQTGGSACVPISLLSTVELTNYVLTIRYPAERLTNLVLHVDSEDVLEGRLAIPVAGEAQVSLDLRGDDVLQGPTNVARLCFDAVSDQASAFVTLEVVDVEGRKPDGGRVASAFGSPGRVAVVGTAPLLEALLASEGEVELVLYAWPGTTHELLSATDDHALAPWSSLGPVTVTNLVHGIGPFPATNHVRFYRAVKTSP